MESNKGKKLSARARIQISKTPAEVFTAIVEPEHLTGYFLAGASGPLAQGRTVYWQFPEFAFQLPVRVDEIDSPRRISFFWGPPDDETLVKVTLEPFDDSTVVAIEETGKAADEAGIAWVIGNTGGWAYFLAFLKAYLEYGINLRLGAFLFLAADPRFRTEQGLE